MGFSEEEIQLLRSALKEARQNGNRQSRRQEYLVDAEDFEKEGGVLKHQVGGVVGGTTKSIGVTERRTSTKGTNYKNAAGISEMGSEN